MLKTNPLPERRSNRQTADNLAVTAFVFITAILLAVRAFPALYGDEYGSLYESRHLASNLHAIGYSTQLLIWSQLSNSDAFLRVLSILWWGAGLYWFNSWLRDEEVSSAVRSLAVWLTLLNPFLWMYGFQIRFYAMFFATSVLFTWRLRAWQKDASHRNAIILVASSLLLLTSHLFGMLVLASAGFYYLWMRLPRKRWLWLAVLGISSVLALLPAVRSALVWVVYSATANSYAYDAAQSARGLSLAMLAKVPLAFYFFTMGERVYPLWWWLTVPAMIVVGATFALGLWHLWRLAGLAPLAIFMLLNVPLLFLVLDPLAPPGLQGATPRYVIFVLPYFLLLIALGAQAWRPLGPVLMMVSLAGLYFLAARVWSYGGGDLGDWTRLLDAAITHPQQSCVVADGRAQAPVMRYAPIGTTIVPMGRADDCAGYSRILLVSDDYRLGQVRAMDALGENIGKDYSPASNVTAFPAQVTVYEQKPAPSTQLVPARLDLPEQDLAFPISIPEHGWQLNGFSRLDTTTPTVAVPVAAGNTGNLWILTNYRTDNDPAVGTPVFSLRFQGVAGREDTDVFLHAGQETSAWEGSCDSCSSVYEWTKSLHLLGSYAYAGAYRQYQAHVWAYQLDLVGRAPETVTVMYLLPYGTGYFWGTFPGGAK